MSYRLFAAAAIAAAAFAVSPAFAASGADVIKSIDKDSDGTLDIAEVLNAGAQTYAAINTDGDYTLEPNETTGRLTAKDWKSANTDGDKTLELDEYLKILRARFKKADPDHDGTLDAKELDTPAGQAVVALIVK